MKKLLKLLKQNYILLLFLLLNFSNLNAQNNWDTKEETYTNGVFLVGLFDMDENKIISLNPKGKNASITYDPFYNTYKINFDDIDGKTEMYFKPKTETLENGTIFIDTYSNSDKNQFFISNTLNKDKKILLISAYPIISNGKQFKMIYAFEDFN